MTTSYQPQPDDLEFDTQIAKFHPRQREAIAALDDYFGKYVLYGGAMGGGKSYLLRWYCVRFLILAFAIKKLRWVQVMLACEDYPSLKDRQLTRIEREFPPWLGRSYTDHKVYGRCYILSPKYGNGVICLRNLDDSSKYACYSSDTEVLIQGKGFIPVSQVVVGDAALSLIPDVRFMSWQKVTATHSYPFTGNMLSCYSRFGPSFTVTPNHKVLHHTFHRQDLILSEARDLPGNFWVPRVGDWGGYSQSRIMRFESNGNNGKSVEFSFEDYLSFLGLYLAEGSCDAERWGIHISQYNGKNHEWISALLDRMRVNWNYGGKSYSFNNKSLVIHLRTFGGRSNVKCLPQDLKDLPPDQLQSLWDGLMIGDGSAPKKDKWIYTTGSPGLRDDVMEIALKLGYVPTTYTYPERDKVYPNGKTYTMREFYHITCTKRNEDTCCRGVESTPYDGMVYCPTVPPYHNILIRHRGRVMFCGQSSEFALIAVDELTKNLLAVFHDLRTRIRWPGFQDHETKFLAGTNPGSVGHGWVKNLWINRSFPEEFHPPFSPVDYRPFFKFIKSKAEDNPSLDSSYWAMLGTLPKALRKAFRDGDWDTFIGQAFQEWDPQRHVITPIPVPENAPMYFTFDWGFGAPFSMGWWWVDNDGRLYRFHEKYGWTGESNVGLRLSEDELVGVMLLEEKKYKINAKQIVKRLAGHDCFARRANPRGGGQGPSTATVFAQHGVRLVPGDPSRDLKIRQFHNRLALPVDGSPPMLQVYSTCEQFIRTIPDLVVDPNNIEYIDEAGEAHCFDEACHVLMARPISVRKGMGEVPVMRREVPLTRNMTVQDVAGLEIQELRDEMEGLRDMEDQQVREALGL